MKILRHVFLVAGLATIYGCGGGSGASTGAAGTHGSAGTTGAAGSGSAGTTGAAGAAGTTGAAGSGSAGSVGSTGSAGTGAAGSVGSTGAAGTTGAAGSVGSTGAAGTTGAAGSGSNPDGGTLPTDGGFPVTTALEAAKGPYTCTEYLGAYLTMEWWGQGFEQIVDNAKWQLKWHHHGHVLEWGNPDSPFWADTGDPMNDASGAPISSACTTNTHAVDRVVLLALSWELLDEKSWMDALEADIKTIRLKRPTAKWIDIVPMVRCPMNKHCNPNANYGPGADTDVGRQDCYVPPYEDSAMQKVVQAHAGDGVGLGPILEATMCNNNGAHLTSADNKLEAQEYGAFYKAIP
jgi:hypothetical protein